MRTHIKAVAKTVAALLLVVILSFNCLTIVTTALGIEDQLLWIPMALTQVTSDSMSPMFETGDVLLLVETPYEELVVGDVVTFHQGEQLVTHEIVGTDGGGFVTQGLANEITDGTITQAEYCAKLWAILPGFGTALDFLTGTWEIAFMLAFVLVLFYGKPCLTLLLDRGTKGGEREKRQWRKALLCGKYRLLGTLTCLSLVMLTPYMTAAKYTAQINEYTMLSAGSIYFTSNYLATEGKTYSISGWKGGAYDFSVQMRGYSNELIYNGEGEDLIYGFYIVPYTVEDGDYGVLDVDYTIGVNTTLTEMENFTYTFPEEIEEDRCYGPYYLAGSDETKQSHTFNFTVSEITDDDGIGSLESGDTIRFRIIATTSVDGQFYMEQYGDFKFIKTDENDFVKSAQLTESGNLVTYTIETDVIDDGQTSKTLIFKWDTTKLYLNEFETKAFDIIMHQSESDPDFSKQEGWIKVDMQAYSLVGLQFFKIDSSDDIDEYYDIYYYVETEDEDPGFSEEIVVEPDGNTENEET